MNDNFTTISKVWTASRLPGTMQLCCVVYILTGYGINIIRVRDGLQLGQIITIPYTYGSQVIVDVLGLII